ncbi:MAG: arginase [Candidatus Saccharibacteria bacterium]
MTQTPHIPATLIGVPLNLGAKNLGVDMGPNAYRYQNIVPKLARVGIEIADSGNVFCEDRWKVNAGSNPKLPYVDEIVRVCTDTAKLVQDSINNQRHPIVLGGDHSICLGAVSGASVAVNGDIGLIYFDAHGDMNTDETSETHNIHGMQLASLMGFGSQQLSNMYKETVKVHKSNVLHIGGSDWDQSELDLIARENIPAFTMDDILTKTFAPLLPMIRELQSRVKYIWISVDLDSIDAQYAPAAGMPNQKGLLYREIKMLAEYIGKHCTVLGLDIVEYNPLEDINHKTAELATELIANFFGQDYSWYTEYLNRNGVSHQ